MTDQDPQGNKAPLVPENTNVVSQAGFAHELTELTCRVQELEKAILKNTFFKEHYKAVSKLSSREIEVMKLAVMGITSKKIAGKLYISSNTVATHRKNIVRKLGTPCIAHWQKVLDVL